MNNYEKICAEAVADDNIVGFFLSGSRGKGMETEHSDYDMVMVVNDEAAAEYKKKFEGMDLGEDDLAVHGLSEFETYAGWGSDTAWDRYDFAHLHVAVDKLDGRIQELVDEKSRVPKEEVAAFTEHALNGYLNSTFRILKCLRDKNKLGARYQAADGVGYLLDYVFALHGRVRPFGKYVDWELKNNPLQKIAMEPSKLAVLIRHFLDGSDATAQKQLLQAIIDSASENGYRQVIAEWEKEIHWMQG